MEKWKDHSDVERVFSPANWGYTVSNSEKAYTSDCPTLQKYDVAYGENMSADWIYIQVLALYGSSSNKDKGVADGIRIFAQSFSSQVKTFKLSEMMLFFARYKAGRYDNSYSTFDAKRIGNAFFKEFIPERNNELDRIERSRIQNEIEQRRFIPPEGFNSSTWYLHLKQRAESGDQEAIKLITPP